MPIVQGAQQQEPGCGIHYKQAAFAQMQEALTYEHFSYVQSGFLFSFLSTHLQYLALFGKWQSAEVGTHSQIKTMHSSSVQ